MATFAADLSRDGPGLLLRDIRAGEDRAVAAARIIAAARPDILLLTDFDHDLTAAALGAFVELVGASGHEMPHHFALPPNAGLRTGLDMDGDGRLGTRRDGQGYGRFPGDGGIALLSVHPIAAEEARDLTPLLWSDLPGAIPPPMAPEVRAIQRLSSTNHWMVPVRIGEKSLTIMGFAATPPVFDGPEDRNGRRNHDEIRLWQVLLDGALGGGPEGPFVLAGNANLDPEDGEGRRDGIRSLLADARLTDPRPARAVPGPVDPRQSGDPTLDTVDWEEEGGPGDLRVSYVLPSADLRVVDAGVFWPGPGTPEADLLGPDGRAAGPHRLVWVDLVID